MDAYKNNVVYLLIALLVLFGLFSLFKPDTPEPETGRKQVTAPETAEESEEKTFDFGKRKHDVDPSQFSSRAEYQQYLNAMRYREIKARQKKENDARKARRKAFRTPGVQKLRQGIGLLRDGRTEVAIQEIRRAMAVEENNKMLQASGYRYLAQAYQDKEDVPHYCLYMYKYLSLAEDLTDSEEAQGVIHDQRERFKEVINQMKAKGHLE